MEPVDPVELDLDDYFEIIKEPMDLSTVEEKLKDHKYNTTRDFGMDVTKIWNNSFRYNTEDSRIYQMTLEMSAYFDKYFQNIPPNESLAEVNHLQRQVTKLQKEISNLQDKKRSRNNRAMTMPEKRNLGQQIRSLPPDCLRGVWRIVSADMPAN